MRCKIVLMIHQNNYFSMMSSSNGSISRVTGPFCGEFTGHRWIPLKKASDAGLFFRLNKRLSKPSGPRRFETPSRFLWRHWNDQWFAFHDEHYFIHMTFKLILHATGQVHRWQAIKMIDCRAESRLAPNLWETLLQSKVVSHWLD